MKEFKCKFCNKSREDLIKEEVISKDFILDGSISDTNTPFFYQECLVNKLFKAKEVKKGVLLVDDDTEYVTDMNVVKCYVCDKDATDVIKTEIDYEV